VSAERAFTRALGASCHSPVAALAILDDGELGMRAQIFSEDGTEMIQDKARFDCGDDDTPAKLAKRMLGNAPKSIRSLFTAV
jgi:hydroxymethylbilane synthase